MHRGYIKFWRAIWDNKYWPTDRPYTKAEAWLDMLLMASYKDTSFEKRGVWVSLKRGQLGKSVKGLAGKWHWSQGKVNRFLNTLKLDKQIEYQKTNVTTIITIINYEIYQGDGDQNGDQTETRRRPDGDQTETYNKVKKLKKVNKVKKEEAPPVSFTSYFPTDWQEHGKFVEWCDKWDALRKKKRWPRNKVTYEAQAEKMLEYDIETAIRALRDSIQSEWQGVFPKPERKDSGAFKGETPEQSADALRRLHSDVNDATQQLQWARDELEFKPKPTSADRVKKAELKLAELKAKLEG